MTGKCAMLRAAMCAAPVLWASCASRPAGEPSRADEPLPHQLAYPQEWPQQTPFRFLVLGDTQTPKRGKPQNLLERRAIYDRLVPALTDTADPARFVLHVGDIVDTGANAAQWEEYFDRLFWDRLTPAQKRRVFPVPGNHEYKSHNLDYGGYDLAHYYERFPHIAGQRYYFFLYGDACFINMDSGRNGVAMLLAGERWQNGFEEQVEWLREVVLPHLSRKATAGEIKRIFVTFHKPGYVSPIQARNRQSVEVLTLLDDFNRTNDYRFDIFALNGHIHTFSHITRDFNGDGRGVVDQLTTGGGGGTQRGAKYFRKVTQVEDLDSFRLEKYRERVPEGEFDQAVFDELRLDNTLFGYLEIEVGDAVRVTYHRIGGGAADFYPDYEFIK